MNMCNQQINMQLQSWRGYSAYEIAVQNGFNGTEKEWLESLKGQPGKDSAAITVNNKSSVSGNITVRGTDIQYRAGIQGNISDEIDKRMMADTIVNALDSSDEQRVLSAAQGKILKALADSKSSSKQLQVNLTSSGWSKQENEEYTQSVAVSGLTAEESETSVAVGCSPNRSMIEEYARCGVIASAQSDDSLTFSATEKPDVDISVSVLLIIQGGT